MSAKFSMMSSDPDVAFPAVLKGSQKQRVPPPVPPRGSPKPKRGGHSQTSLDSKAGAPLSCCSTPPPPFEDSLPPRTSRTNSSSTTSSSASGRRRGGASSAASVMTTSSASSLALTPAALSSARSNDASVCWTPPASIEGSTPTWTEGTPSYTESSSSEQGYPLTPLRVSEGRRSPRAPPPPARTVPIPATSHIDTLTNEVIEMTHLVSEMTSASIAIYEVHQIETHED